MNLSRPAVILALAIVIGSALGAYGLYAGRRQPETLEVTGSAKHAIASDTVRWTTLFSRSVTQEDLRQGHQQMTDDLKKVLAFYAAKGHPESDLTVSPVQMEQDYSYNQLPDAPKRYALRQTVELVSSDIEGVTAMSKGIQALIEQGVIFSTTGLEYTYSKLPELRVSLLGDAVKDAQARAQAIAEAGGKGIGPLTTASVGVVQVLAPNSTEVSDYGSYDTSHVEKEVMVTVRASFIIR